MRCVEWSPCGRYLAAGSFDAKTTVWRRKGGAVGFVLCVRSHCFVGLLLAEFSVCDDGSTGHWSGWESPPPPHHHPCPPSPAWGLASTTVGQSCLCGPVCYALQGTAPYGSGGGAGGSRERSEVGGVEQGACVSPRSGHIARRHPPFFPAVGTVKGPVSGAQAATRAAQPPTDPHVFRFSFAAAQRVLRHHDASVGCTLFRQVR